MPKITAERDIALHRVLASYDCMPLKITQIKGGFVNHTYLVTTKSGDFILRESSVEKTLAHLKFEIEILRHLQSRRFPLTAQIVATNKGGQYVAAGNKLYILQTRLSGKGVASWLDLTGLTLPRLKSYFAATAKFSKAISKYKGHGPASAKTIDRIAATASHTFDSYLKTMPGSSGKTLLSKREPELKRFFAETVRLLKSSFYKTEPRQIVHFDLQPGNFHFAGNQVVGLFDFDWARRDCAFVDLAGTICQSCYYDRGHKAGVYQPQRVRAGISAYLKAYGGTIDKTKMAQLMTAIQRAYDTYQFLFIMEWYGKDPKAPKALKLLKQFINLQLGNNHADLFRQALNVK